MAWRHATHSLLVVISGIERYIHQMDPLDRASIFRGRLEPPLLNRRNEAGRGSGNRLDHLHFANAAVGTDPQTEPGSAIGIDVGKGLRDRLGPGSPSFAPFRG